MKDFARLAAILLDSPKHATLSLVPLFAALAWSHAQAATLCVQANDTAGLKAAFVTAASNGEDDVIKLQSGYYFMPSTFFLGYIATDPHDLTIEGGYAEYSGDPCGLAPLSPDARQTVLDGGQLALILPDGSGSIALKALTVRNEVGSSQNGGLAVQIGGTANSTGSVAVSNSIFTGISSVTNNAIFMAPGPMGGTLSIQNSVFASNGSFAGKSPIAFAAAGPNDALVAEITNSTFTNNLSSVAAVKLYVPSGNALLANDIFWSNYGGDMDIHFPSTTWLLNDDLTNLDEAANTQSFALLSVDPLFNADFSLKDVSPLRDAGSDGSIAFYPGESDVIGNSRTYGTYPDIGAYEIQDVIFADDFD